MARPDRQRAVADRRSPRPSPGSSTTSSPATTSTSSSTTRSRASTPPTLDGLTVALYDPPNGIGAPPAGVRPTRTRRTSTSTTSGRTSPPVDYDTILRGVRDRPSAQGHLDLDVRRRRDDLRRRAGGRRHQDLPRPVAQLQPALDFATASLDACDTRDPSTLAYALGASTAIVNFVVFTELAASLPTSDGLDDGLAGRRPADLPVHQRRHHRHRARRRPAGRPHRVHGGRRDALLAGPHPRRRPPADDRRHRREHHDDRRHAQAALGGIGLPTDFLEINVDRNNGADRRSASCKAYDTAADDALTLGIYLDELVGAMKVFTVWTAGSAGSLSTGNVSLRTVNGSILDARNNGAGDSCTGRGRRGLRRRARPDVDIDANGGEHRRGRQRPRDRLVARLDLRRARRRAAPTSTTGTRTRA